MIYFDHASGIRPEPEALDFFRRTAEENFANQESAHRAGYELRKKLETAGEKLAMALTGKKRFVFWGTSGTDVLLAAGYVARRQNRQIRLSDFCHPAIAAAFAASSGNGRKTLAVYPAVESETGMLDAGISPPGSTDSVFCDAIQAAGKILLPDTPDWIAVSGSKLGGLGGAALLFRDETQAPLFDSYRREHRTGRPFPAQCLTLAFAAERALRHLEKNQSGVRKINAFLREKLSLLPLPGGGKIRPTLPEEKASPFILHLTLPGIQTGVLVRMLGDHGAACSAGSACEAESSRPSPVLLAMGYSRQDAYSGLRLSFSPGNTLEEARQFVELLTQTLKEY